MRILPRVRRLAILVAVLGLATGFRQGLALSALAATTRFEPAFAQARPNQVVRLEVWIASVGNLERLEVTVSYDSAALEPLDAYPWQEGVQLEVGPVFANGYVPQNQAAEGTLRLVACRSPADGPFSGEGVVAAVTFRVREETTAGSYPVRFAPESLRLLDPDGQPLAAEMPTDALIWVPPVTTALQGLVAREGTSAHGRTAVTAMFYASTLPELPPAWARACTAIDGAFLLPVPEGNDPLPPDLPDPDDSPLAAPFEWAFIRLDFPNHLSECYWEPLDDEVVDIGRHVLQGGDVNEDGCINIYDIVRIIGDFGETVPSPCLVPYTLCPEPSPGAETAPASDINGDCRVNIVDLTIAARNFTLCSNCQ